VRFVRANMANWRSILILIIVLLVESVPHGSAQTTRQLSMALIGQGAGEYVTPAGQTTDLKMEILNAAPSDIYLLEGDAYLDPNLNGTWELIHSESLGDFHLGYLQSAIWTFGLAVPSKIQAANATNGLPQVELLIKITYMSVGGIQDVEQGAFTLSVPGATLPEQNDVIWLAFLGILVVASAVIVYSVKRRGRAR